MTWEPKTSADLEEKVAVVPATHLGDSRAVTWAEVQEHTHKISAKRLKTVSRSSPHGWILFQVTGSFPIQVWTQYSRWIVYLQQQDSYLVTTKDTDHRDTAFCSSRCNLRDFQGGM